jgi:RNA polymerase sigma factor (sigma-70 family)
MNDAKWIAERFESARPHLRAVAYRMLGSDAEAEDVVQDAWVRLERTEPDQYENFTGWLTTIVARLCLDRLRARRSRREVAAGAPLEPAIDLSDDADPEQHVLLADAVGSAFLVVLDLLNPAERVAFVLHDIFAVPFPDIAGILDRSPQAARQLASRARRRVQGAADGRPLELDRQRQVIDAFLAASRKGDFEALMTILDPDATFRADEAAVRIGGPAEADGADAVARIALGRAFGAEPGLIDGSVGLVWAPGGRPQGAFCFVLVGGRIAAINMIADPKHIRELEIALLEPRRDPDA